MRHAAYYLIFLVASVCAASAQVGGTGSIQGTVTDPSGATIAGAEITATNSATGVATTRTSTQSGAFVLPLLPAGDYTVTMKAPGFQTLTQEHVVVDALANVGLNSRLQVGAATQSITVESGGSILKTDDVALGSVMENSVYDALPLAMNGSARDPSAFAGLASGVDNYSTQAAGPSTGSFNGGQTYQNEVYIEGLPLTSAGTESDTRNLAFGVSVEAVDQFQVEASGAKAMYEGQGVSNYVLKSGANQFHGGVFEYFRNTDFDARGFFAATTPIEHQNEFGGTVSGPIKRNKAFFFGSYDGYRYDSASPPGYQSIPTTAERNGDFSAFPQLIYDPTSATGSNPRTPFANNTIPMSRISAISQSFQSYLPAPTNGAIQNNYLATLPILVNNDNTTEKVDYNLSDKNRLFGLLSWGKYTTNFTGSLTALSTSTLPPPYTAARVVAETSNLGQIHDSYIISPTVVNQLSVSYSRLWIPLGSDSASGNYPMKAGLTGLPAGLESTALPDLSFGGTNAPVSWAGTNSHVYNEAQNTTDVQDNVVWVKGKHNFTFGFQFQSLQDNETFSQFASFTFSNAETEQFSAAGSPVNNTGLGYAGFLLGAVDSASAAQYSVAETGGRYKTYAFYAQDDFKVTSRLTLNLGLRENIWSPFTEVNNVMSFLNPTEPNPLAGGIPGALQFAGNGPDSCGCSTPVKQHNVNLAPRLGLAWQAAPKTVIRASYGIFYAHAGGVGGRTNGRQGLGQLGFTSANSFSSTVTGQPAFYWNTGFPANPLPPPFFNPSYGIGFIPASLGASIGAGPGTGQTIPYGDPNLGGKAPYYENWSANVQQSLTPNLVFTAAYSASVGHFLPGASVAGEFTNQIPEQYLPLGSLLTQTLTPTTLAQAQAIFPSIKIPFPNFTGTIAQALKPFPQYGGISDPWLDVGNSAYHSIQLSLNHRLSHGLSFMVNYTYSKELDDLAGARDPNKDYLERAPGSIDHPNVAAATFVYQLPFGEGKKWSNSNKLVSAAISHWQVSGIFTFSSGAPLSITASNCTSTAGLLGSCFPNYATGFSGSVWQNGTIGTGNLATTAYLNKAAFVDPPSYTVGDVARSAPFSLYAPHNADLDLSIRREFRIVERVRLAFQADAFNINNAVHFGAPGTNIDAATFGIVSSQANQPRKLQFSARLSF